MQEARGTWAQLAEDAGHSDVAHWNRPRPGPLASCSCSSWNRAAAEWTRHAFQRALALLDGRDLDHPDAVEQIYIYRREAAEPADAGPLDYLYI